MRLGTDSINSSGQIVGFGLHDSGLTGLVFEDGDEFTLTVRRLDGTLLRVAFNGVGPVGILGFRNGAILAEVFVWKPDSVPATAITRSDGPWNVLFANNVQHADLLDSIDGIVREGLFSYIVLVECSYGGSIAALCQTIDIETIEMPSVG